jgi:hypothetical protein
LRQLRGDPALVGRRVAQNPGFKELQDNRRVESKQVVIDQIEKFFDN